MAKYCKYCGKELRDNAMFCSGCGRSLAESRPAEPPKTEEKKTGQKEKPKDRKASAGKKKPIFGGINALLVFCLLVELAVAGFKWPGWFVNKTKPDLPEIISKPLEGLLPASRKSRSVNEIQTVYTREELEAAPKIEAKVTREEPSVQAGDYTVGFKDWNLEHEDDTVVIRTLPVKQDPSTGFTMNSFDITLESGQDEFLTEVTIDIPTSVSPNDVSYCLYYDEQQKKWEYVSSDLSEDGTSRRIYTRHFTKFTEVRLKASEVGRAADFSSYDLYNIMYVFPVGNEVSGIHLSLPVRMNYNALWDYLYKKQTDDVTSVAEAVSRNSRNPALELSYPNLLAVTDTTNNTAVLTDSYGSVSGKISTNSWFHKTMDSAGGRTLGNIMAVFSVYGAYLKTANEVVDGKTWWSAAMNNKLDIAAAGVSAAAAIYGAAASTGWAAGTAVAAAGPWVAGAAAITGIGVFAYGLYQSAHAGEEDRALDVTESIYRDFYIRDGKSRIFYYDVPVEKDYIAKNIGVMKSLPSLSDQENELLKTFINSPLKTGEPAGILGFSPMQAGKRRRQESTRWMRTIYYLYAICAENKPERLAAVIREFYESYARAAFTMGTGNYQEFGLDDMQYRGYDSTMTELLPDDQRRNQMIDNMVAECYENDLSFHRTMVEEFKHVMELKIYHAVEETLLPALNTTVEFSVKDIKGSVYTADYRNLKTNQPFIDQGNYAKVRSPLRFASGSETNYAYVSSPQFVPWEYYSSPNLGFHAVPLQYYYPKKDSFLPEYRKEGDLVFRCTLYHYLMMGAPNVMVFDDINLGTPDPIAVEFSLPESKTDGKLNVEISLPKDLTIHDFIGVWEDENKEGYIGISVNAEGEAGEYEGENYPGTAGWVLCEKYQIDRRTKTLTLYSEHFIGPAKFRLIDSDTMEMPDQKEGFTRTLYRVKNSFFLQLQKYYNEFMDGVSS